MSASDWLPPRVAMELAVARGIPEDVATTEMLLAARLGHLPIMVSRDGGRPRSPSEEDRSLLVFDFERSLALLEGRGPVRIAPDALDGVGFILSGAVATDAYLGAALLHRPALVVLFDRLAGAQVSARPKGGRYDLPRKHLYTLAIAAWLYQRKPTNSLAPLLAHLRATVDPKLDARDIPNKDALERFCSETIKAIIGRS